MTFLIAFTFLLHLWGSLEAGLGQSRGYEHAADFKDFDQLE